MNINMDKEKPKKPEKKRGAILWIDPLFISGSKI